MVTPLFFQVHLKRAVMGEDAYGITLQFRMEAVPEGLQAIPVKLIKYRLTGGVTGAAKGNYGRVTSSYFKGDGFAIWFNNFDINNACNFIFNYPAPLLFLYIPLISPLAIYLNNTGGVHFSEQQFNMFYSSTGDTQLQLPSAKHYQSFSIGFDARFLQPYSLYCDQLASLLAQAAIEKPAWLLDTVQFLSLDMMAVFIK